MKKFGMTSLGIVVAIMSSGCSTMFNGSTTTLNFDSEPRGATVTIPNGVKCVTPCSMVVPTETETVTFEKNGHQSNVVMLDRKVSVGWGIVGNVLISYGLTIAIDYATGALWYIDNKTVNVRMGQKTAEFKLEPGKTKMEDIKLSLGEPQFSFEKDGKTVYQYQKVLNEKKTIISFITEKGIVEKAAI